MIGRGEENRECQDYSQVFGDLLDGIAKPEKEYRWKKMTLNSVFNFGV